MLLDSVIEVEKLSKIYRIANKEPGLLGTLHHFFRRKTVDVDAVKDVSFVIRPGKWLVFLGQMVLVKQLH